MTVDPHDPTLVSDTEARSEGDPEEAYCPACSQSFPMATTTCPNDGARLIRLAARNDDLIGRQLDGRYEIRAPLGRGGMGTVYRGWQLSVDREVAIKVVSPKFASDRNAVKRFLREARLASRLSQPNVVNVYDFGQADSVLYLVMELLRGHTLASELGDGRRFNVRRTVIVGSQLCDALEAAHAQGIVHRDLKPSNIVILDDPPGRDLIKVLDFGLAKSLVQDSGSAVTNSDALLGTPLYMAPEQIEGKDTDQRVDLYALGCILYEMLTGLPPFVDSAVSAVLSRHLSETQAPLPAHVPAKLRVLIDRLLAKDPGERVQSAAEIRATLDVVRDDGSARNTPPFEDLADTTPEIHLALAETMAPLAQAAAADGADVAAPPRRWGWLIVAAAAAALGVVAVLVATSHEAATTPIDAASPRGVIPATADAAAAVRTPDAGGDAAVVPIDAPVDAPRPIPHHRRADAGSTDDPPIQFHP